MCVFYKCNSLDNFFGYDKEFGLPGPAQKGGNEPLFGEFKRAFSDSLLA